MYISLGPHSFSMLSERSDAHENVTKLGIFIFHLYPYTWLTLYSSIFLCSTLFFSDKEPAISTEEATVGLKAESDRTTIKFERFL